jgi:hypothetical protein
MLRCVRGQELELVRDDYLDLLQREAQARIELLKQREEPEVGPLSCLILLTPNALDLVVPRGFGGGTSFSLPST